MAETDGMSRTFNGHKSIPEHVASLKMVGNASIPSANLELTHVVLCKFPIAGGIDMLVRVWQTTL